MLVVKKYLSGYQGTNSKWSQVFALETIVK